MTENPPPMRTRAATREIFLALLLSLDDLQGHVDAQCLHYDALQDDDGPFKGNPPALLGTLLCALEDATDHLASARTNLCNAWRAAMDLANL